ncbi:MAG: translocation/assembly module TamB domain-containing protein [Opitutaceae bacterium]|nr:translocation/assembly module TamB domain-containing protein [Opitutaceae bacterium]
MRRRLLIILSIAVAVLMLGAATLPWWLGAALGGAGASRGLTFARYERIGYTRFALHGAELKVPGVRVTASRIEADTPLVAWWRRGQVVVGQWTVDVAERKADVPVNPANRGWMPLRATLEKIAAQLARWAPRVSAEAGVVRWPGGELTCGAALWAERTLAVKALAFHEFKADVSVAFAPDALRVEARATDGGATLVGRGADVKGELTWWGQRAELNARFDERGWLPAEVVLQAEDWNVPGEKLKLGAAYEAVRGRGKIEWRGEKLVADFVAKGEPVSGKTVPPLEVTLRGQGDAEAFTVESLNADLPGIVARLTEPVTVERSGKFRQSGARFSLEADLEKQPWFTAKGAVSGEARWVSSLGQAPVVEFRLTGRDVAAADWAASLVEAKGQFDWPRVKVSEGTLAGTTGEKLTWRGGWDFSTKEIFDAAAEGTIRRATVARWVPADVEFESITLKAEATGAPMGLKHAGQAQAEKVTFRALKPLGLALTWAGSGSTMESIRLVAKAGATTITAEGASSGQSARLTKLELVQGDDMRLQLKEPAMLRWRPALAVEALHLAGPEGAVEAALSWGETGRVEMSVRNFSSAWLDDLELWSGPAWKVSSLEAKGAWDRGPMIFSLKTKAAIELGDGKSAIIAATAQGDKSGVRIEELSVIEAEKSVVKVVGRIPLRLSPGAAQPVELEPEGALMLDVTTEAGAAFWQELQGLTGFELKDPEAEAHVTGTWARPKGTVRVKAARVAADATRFKRPMPTIEALAMELTGDEAGVRLEKLSLSVEGQAVRASGRLPVAEGKWREFLTKPMLALQGGAEGKIEVPDADVAAVARFLPVFVAPKGRLSVDVSFRNGALDGMLRLRDAATRPLGPLGVLQEISAEVALVGRKMELRSVTAQTGGQTVTLSGSVELPVVAEGNAAAMVDGLKFDLALKGENLPFVRQTGVLVRGDLDLKLTSPASGPPLIAGAVRLRESLFLSDLRALLPGGARSKARTPPYFAVEAEPYDAWRLDVAVQGEKFLKLRTALFNGLASARFQLSGTLGEPLARGEATIDEGTVKLPFATFVVQEGRVSLTPEQGVDPQVWFVGTVRRMNYDLRMEASGPASAPNLVFSSSPPLESGQVLLMVMTGESPHDEFNASDRQRMARLGAFLGQSLLASFGGDSDASERLSISTGENVSRQGRETYGIEYRLSERWTAVGEYDEFDDFNVGLKWRVFSKGGTKESDKK